MLERLASWLLKHSTFYDNIEGYMERRWVFRLGRWGKNEKYGWIAGRLNHILRSDNDRHLHDHPWPYITLILRGGYAEVTENALPHAWENSYRSKWYGPGSILFRGTKHRHRLVLPPGQTALTFFITLPMVQGWGFYVDGEKVPWREYLAGNKQ